MHIKYSSDGSECSCHSLLHHSTNRWWYKQWCELYITETLLGIWHTFSCINYAQSYQQLWHIIVMFRHKETSCHTIKYEIICVSQYVVVHSYIFKFFCRHFFATSLHNSCDQLLSGIAAQSQVCCCVVFLNSVQK